MNPVCGLFFHYCNNAFSREEAFNFNKIKLNFSFIDCAFSSVSTNSLLNSRLFTLGLLSSFYLQFYILTSVQFSCSVMSDSLWPHGLQHARLPCPSPTPGACANSCPSSRWCHPTISSSLIPFSSCLQSFPTSASFPMSQFFTSGGPKYWSFSFSISPYNEYSGLISLRMDWFDLLAVLETLKFSPTPWFKSINSSVLSFLYSPTLISVHDYWKNHSFN